MKIQNAEMEFVSFDAQDVIATSGGLKKAYFVMSNDLYPIAAKYGAQYETVGSGGVWMWGNPIEGDHAQQFTSTEYRTFVMGTSYQLIEGTTAFVGSYSTYYNDDDGESGKVYLTGVSVGSEGIELDSLLKIIDWIKNPQ